MLGDELHPGTGRTTPDDANPGANDEPMSDRPARWFRAIVEHARDMVVTIDRSGCITWVSPSVTRTLGYRVHEVVARVAMDFVHPDDRANVTARLDVLLAGTTGPTFECRYRHVNGEWRILELSATNQLDDPTINAVICNARDVTALRAAKAELEFNAGHDPLTGLANRRLFFDLADQALARAARERTATSVLFVDLDGFKAINDNLGHAAGDGVLRAVASRLTESARAGDVIGRLGGDEFAVLCERTTEADAQELAQRLTARVIQPVEIADPTATTMVGMSVGVAVDAIGAGSAADLVREADRALYRAKNSIHRPS